MKMKVYKRWLKSAVFTALALFGMSNAAFADLNTIMSVSGGYVAGGTSAITFTMTINSGTVEYASLVTLTLPAGWSGTFDPGSVGSGACAIGAGVVCQQGGQVLIIGDPTCAPDDGCGPWANGTFTITVNVTAPVSASGAQSIGWLVEGDGFGCGACSCGAWTCDSGSLSIAQLLCEITCPTDIVVANDPGQCEAFVS
ncbi:MAG: hypothetical protein KDC41_05625, partial [Saprospiraceae bacterium]|nr:hypothetical protein [Saprospiraceae bacterium]